MFIGCERAHGTNKQVKPSEQHEETTAARFMRHPPETVTSEQLQQRLLCEQGLLRVNS
jgi:hypothetical protein